MPKYALYGLRFPSGDFRLSVVDSKSGPDLFRVENSQGYCPDCQKSAGMHLIQWPLMVVRQGVFRELGCVSIREEKPEQTANMKVFLSGCPPSEFPAPPPGFASRSNLIQSFSLDNCGLLH